jgi:hypothetical protein
MSPGELANQLDSIRDEHTNLIAKVRQLEDKVDSLQYVIARSLGYMERGSLAIAKQTLKETT